VVLVQVGAFNAISDIIQHSTQPDQQLLHVQLFLLQSLHQLSQDAKYTVLVQLVPPHLFVKDVQLDGFQVLLD
jgi:hypothetical protein